MVQARGSIPLGGTKILLLNFLKLKIMCIISIKKRGVKFQSTETIKAMCDNNPDGFSMVYQIGSCKPEIYKTLNKEKFLNQYKKITTMYDADDVSMFIHARIKTHGTKRIENCHGWKADGLIFAHNGMLPIDNRGDMTDSEHSSEICSYLPTKKADGKVANVQSMPLSAGVSSSSWTRKARFASTAIG